jgi:hypothetical protein
MLDICFENSNGKWVAIWWDDCVYRSDYVKTLMAHADPGAVVLIQNMTVFDKATNSVLTMEPEQISFPLFARCRPVNFGIALDSQFEMVKTLSNDPELVVKVLRVLRS